MNPLDPEAGRPDDILAVYLVVNEEFAMSPGKLAAQAFQACQRLLAAAQDPGAPAERRAALDAWQAAGTRTVCKFAATRHLFDRARSELDGVTMLDEGLTEGTCGPTAFATWPLRRGDLPPALRHKRIRLQPTARPGPSAPGRR